MGQPKPPVFLVLVLGSSKCWEQIQVLQSNAAIFLLVTVSGGCPLGWGGAPFDLAGRVFGHL